MPEKKPETATPTSSTTTRSSPKKANLLDHHSTRHLLDESVTEIVTSKGFIEDVRMSNIRLLIGSVIIIIALFAQFYNKKFPENRNFLIGCIVLHKIGKGRVRVGSVAAVSIVEDSICYFIRDGLGEYILFNGILQLIIYTKEKNAILFTHPPADSFNSTGLVVSSKLPRFSDMYTLTIASADPQSISAKPLVEFTKSVTQWFTKDGILVEGLFWKDVEGLIHDYTKESKKSK